MRVLLTGSTGFLGKQVLKLLIKDKRVSKIIAISRSKTTHPDKKVEVQQINLAAPQLLMDANIECDVVLHLAGRYNFNDEFPENYINNVVGTANLVTLLKGFSKKVPIHFASSYAVGSGNWHLNGAEEKTEILPKKDSPYPLTKAMAEEAILNSKNPAAFYRLGILVGDDEKGAVEKIDGPYYFMQIFNLLAKYKLMRKVPFVVLPASADSFLPLVPVNVAARVFAEAIFRDLENDVKIYGVYNSESVLLGEFLDDIFEFFELRAKPIFVRNIPKKVMKLQSKITRIPGDLFDFAGNVPKLQNLGFQKEYSGFLVPHFEEYREIFFNGFKECT